MPDSATTTADSVISRALAAYDSDDWTIYGQMYAERAVLHHPDGPVVGRDAIVAHDRLIRMALDPTVARDLFVVADPLIAWRWQIRGHHVRQLGDQPPSGKPISFTGASIASIEHGQITELWIFPDRLGLARQLGPQIRD